ncbi:MAG TPA: hypothetical protein VFP80_08605 [Thermoanaerobaculia bacterium]|nr:hypothetical protein [Thermoanaerobaculia bacterium]
MEQTATNRKSNRKAPVQAVSKKVEATKRDGRVGGVRATSRGTE